MSHPKHAPAFGRTGRLFLILFLLLGPAAHANAQAHRELLAALAAPDGTYIDVAYLLKDINITTTPGSSPQGTIVVNGVAYFRGCDASAGCELWKSDGTAAGTALVKDVWPGSSSNTLGSLTNVTGTIFFVSNDSVNGVDLWKSDGTTAGTVLVKNISPGGAPAPLRTGPGTTPETTAPPSRRWTRQTRG